MERKEAKKEIREAFEDRIGRPWGKMDMGLR